MIHPWQIALITLYAFIQPNETRSFNIGMSMPILAGWFTGLLLGNPQTGLVLGGTLQLMTLGVNTYGGTSIPNTTVGAIVGTALSEAQIESLVIAKGYDDCVTYINDGVVCVAVSAPADGLSDADAALISDIVTSQTDYSLSQVRIIEVKP